MEPGRPSGEPCTGCPQRARPSPLDALRPGGPVWTTSRAHAVPGAFHLLLWLLARKSTPRALLPAGSQDLNESRFLLALWVSFQKAAQKGHQACRSPGEQGLLVQGRAEAGGPFECVCPSQICWLLPEGWSLEGRGRKAEVLPLLSLLSRKGREASEVSSGSHCVGVPVVAAWASPWRRGRPQWRRGLRGGGQGGPGRQATLV